MFNIFSRKDNREKLEQGLEKTKQGFFARLGKALIGKTKIDDEVLDELEEILIGGDVGVKTTLKIIQRIEKRVARDKYSNASELDTILKDEILQLMLESHPKIGVELPEEELKTEDGKKIPYVIMVVGVNGVGKTTTIGKLANRFKVAGKHVLLGAGDTFRAAAVDQLTLWAKRVGVNILSKGMNADPAAVAYDSVRQGIAEGADVVIVDTAGRLHNKVNLMNELSKIKRSMGKMIAEAPHEVILVLDASTGQNAIAQAEAFTQATQVSALAITKLDGTAKGGVVIGITDQFQIPVKYIGVGEGMEDLQAFDPETFIDSLFRKK